MSCEARGYGIFPWQVWISQKRLFSMPIIEISYNYEQIFCLLKKPFSFPIYSEKNSCVINILSFSWNNFCNKNSTGDPLLKIKKISSKLKLYCFVFIPFQKNVWLREHSETCNYFALIGSVNSYAHTQISIALQSTQRYWRV